MDEAKISNSWRLCEELTVKQAALLYAGCDPASNDGASCEGWKPYMRPEGYEGAKQSISAALRKSRITGTHVEVSDTDINGNHVGYLPNTTDIDLSEVDRDSLVEWLRLKGVTTGFFFPAVADAPGYLDPGHPRYAPKLAAAVRVWQAMGDANLLGKSKPKDAMEKWLEVNYKELGLIHKQGNAKGGYKTGDRSKSAVIDVAALANWDTGGGPPSTPGG